MLSLFGVSVLVAIPLLQGLMSGDVSRLGILPRDLARLRGPPE